MTPVFVSIGDRFFNKSQKHGRNESLRLGDGAAQQMSRILEQFNHEQR